MDNSIFGSVDVRRLLQEAEPTRWVIEDILPSGSIVIAAAPPKAGKTYAAMRAALAVSRGEKFLGKATERRRVIYLFLEDGRKRTARRFRQLGLREDDDIKFFAIFDGREIEQLIDAVEKSDQPILLVIDPLVVLERILGVKDENVALEIEKVFARLRQAVQATESTILIIHHFRKQGDTMRGSVALEGSSDGWWNLNRQKRSRIVRMTCVLRDAEETEIAFEMLQDGDSVSFERQVMKAVSDPEPRGRREEILSLLNAKAPALMSQKAIADELGVRRAMVQGVLKDLERDGAITRPKGRRGGYTIQPSRTEGS